MGLDLEELRDVVSELQLNMASVDPSAEDFLVDRAWAERLLRVVYGWDEGEER